MLAFKLSIIVSPRYISHKSVKLVKQFELRTKHKQNPNTEDTVSQLRETGTIRDEEDGGERLLERCL